VDLAEYKEWHQEHYGVKPSDKLKESFCKLNNISQPAERVDVKVKTVSKEVLEQFKRDFIKLNNFIDDEDNTITRLINTIEAAREEIEKLKEQATCGCGICLVHNNMKCPKYGWAVE
jgi:hypothetical protein